MNRIILLLSIFLIFSCNSNAQKIEDKQQKPFSVEKTDAEWKQELTEQQYYVLRQAGTERPFSSPLNDNTKRGTYICAACSTPLFKSEHKFDSGTGWPSFDREIKGNVAYGNGYENNEEHCATCGGHLGHVFNDGPNKTTGIRHCINGVSLKFIPSE